MTNRVQVVALKPFSLGGISYAKGEVCDMARSRLKQYQAVARLGRDAVVREATPADLEQPPAPAPRQARTVTPTPPASEPAAREASVVNPTRYRTRRLKAED